MKLSFSKNRRLKDREVKLLLKKAKKVSGKNFILYVSKNQFPFCRLVISISKETIKLSSKRNLLRRRIKTSLIQAQREAVMNEGYDMLIVVRAKELFSYEAIRKDIFGLLKGVG